MAEGETTAGTSDNFPMTPSQESQEWPADATCTDNQADTTEEPPLTNRAAPENIATAKDDEWTYGSEEPMTAEETSPITNTLMPTSPPPYQKRKVMYI